MAGCHVAHDVRVGDRVILVNHAAIAGHCDIGDDVIVGGLCGIHQWVRIGRGAIIGAVTMVTNDVIPFGLVQGPRGRPHALGVPPQTAHGARMHRGIQTLKLQFLKIGKVGPDFQHIFASWSPKRRKSYHCHEKIRHCRT